MQIYFGELMHDFYKIIPILQLFSTQTGFIKFLAFIVWLFDDIHGVRSVVNKIVYLQKIIKKYWLTGLCITSAKCYTVGQKSIGQPLMQFVPLKNIRGL